jgi:hypothetical protein
MAMSRLSRFILSLALVASSSLALVHVNAVHAAAVTWTGAGLDGLWDNGANWSTQVAPGPTDDVVIGGSANVTFLNAQGNDGAPYTVSSLTLSGGSSLTIQSGPEGLSITNSLMLGDTSVVRIGGATQQGSLIFRNAPATIGGTGRLVFGQHAQNALGFQSSVSSDKLTIGSGVTIEGAAGAIAVQTAGNSLINRGTISASTPGGNIRLNGGSNWVNTGTIQVSAGTLVLDGSYWTSSGSIRLTGGTLNLAGTFRLPDGLFGGGGAFTRTGGSLAFSGTLDNVGRTTTLTSAIGSVDFTGSISGGTVKATAGNAFVANWSCSLTAVLDGSGGNPSPLDLRTTGATVYVSHNLTLAGGAVLNMGNPAGTTTATIMDNGDYSGTVGLTIGGNGRIVMGNSLSNQIRLYRGGSGPNNNLVINPGVPIEGTGYLWSMNDVINNGTVTLSGAMVAGYLQRVLNNGTLTVGSATSVGRIDVTGDFAQGSNALLNMKISTASSFDQVVISGKATLAGALNVKLLGTAPPPNNSWRVLSANPRTATFATTTVPAGFRVVYDGTGVVLAN